MAPILPRTGGRLPILHSAAPDRKGTAAASRVDGGGANVTRPERGRVITVTAGSLPTFPPALDSLCLLPFPPRPPPRGERGGTGTASKLPESVSAFSDSAPFDCPSGPEETEAPAARGRGAAWPMSEDSGPSAQGTARPPALPLAASLPRGRAGGDLGHRQVVPNSGTRMKKKK